MDLSDRTSRFPEGGGDGAVSSHNVLRTVPWGIKYVEAVEGEEAHVAVQLTADAAAGEKKTKKAPELVPMRPLSLVRLGGGGVMQVLDGGGVSRIAPRRPLSSAKTSWASLDRMWGGGGVKEWDKC